jgi:hypothetical protein
MSRLIGIAAIAVVSWPSLACAPVGPEGARISVSEEQALIIWEASKKRQHFIRRASFESSAKDFGFLVPTPSQPELAEADGSIFEALRVITAPKIVGRAPVASSAAPAASAPAPAAVTVLAEKTVAGLDAVVLEATNAKALDRWLGEHGYRSSPQLVEWYKPYIANRWKITAFKISTAEPHPSTGTVRMSFAAEEPFFPYREPQAENPGTQSRTLRVFLLAQARFAGTLGNDAEWPGQSVWSDRISDGQRSELARLAKLGPDDTTGIWLTEFEDRSAIRPGSDEVFFKVATEQSATKRADVVFPDSGLSGLEILFYLALCAVLLWVAYRLVARSRAVGPQ